MDKITIEVNEQFYTLIPKQFEGDIDIQSYLTIDHGNIIGELMTMPLVLNQISNLKAEVDNQVAEQKAFLKILKSTLEKDFKEEKAGGKSPTINDLEIHVNTHDQYKDELSKLINLEKKASYVEGFMWSAKAKIDALDKISSKLSPDEFNIDLLERSINNVLIKRFNGKI